MKIRALFIGLAMLALASFSAGAYTFGREEGLTKMKERADLICKARVVSSEAITNAVFRPVYRYQTTATTLEIITVL